jgi:hypothetical protein
MILLGTIPSRTYILACTIIVEVFRIAFSASVLEGFY